jgi:hypothetical protein
MTAPTLGLTVSGAALSIDVDRLIATDAALSRFRSKFEISESGCWIWTASFYSVGYARFSIDGRWVIAHRWCYERLRGVVPFDRDLDHLCRERRCVNPWHLEPVTRRENLLRGDTIPARNAAKAACPKGHDCTPENTRLYRGMRYCRECNRARNRAYKRAKRVDQLLEQLGPVEEFA